MSLLCPPVATAVKYCLSHFLYKPNWSHSEFYYPVIGVHHGVISVSSRFIKNLRESPFFKSI